MPQRQRAPAPEIARRFVVRGRVQGVFYRASCRTEAVRLKLRGSAINLPDGSVEVLAAGSQGALLALATWLRQGPPLAKVESVTEFPHLAPIPQGFTVA